MTIKRLSTAIAKKLEAAGAYFTPAGIIIVDPQKFIASYIALLETQTNTTDDDRLMLKPEVKKITGLSDTTIWRLETAGKFPARHKQGRQVMWFRSDITAYLESVRADGAVPAPVKAIQGRRDAIRRRRGTK